MGDIGPGDLVVCVDASEHRPRQRVRTIREGFVYEVEGVRAARMSGLPALLIRRTTFHVTRFRKFDEGDSARLSEMFTVKEIANA